MIITSGDVHRTIEGVYVETTKGRIEYRLPFVRGTHRDAFRQLNEDKEVRPAEDIELVYIFREAFPICEGREKQSDGWKRVWNDLVNPSYLRNPKRLQYIPANYPFEEGGVVVQRDIKGLGVSCPIPYKEAKGEWKLQDGIYVNETDEMVFVPTSKYKIGKLEPKDFVKDGLMRALLGGEESAEIFAKIAKDNKRKLRSWALNPKNPTEVSEETLRVAGLCGGGGDSLVVVGNDFGDYGSDCASGVF